MVKGRPAIIKANPNPYAIEWDEETIDHIRKHGTEPDEVESVFDHKFYDRKRKEFIDVLGITTGGRILFVVLEKAIHGFRPVFARDATNAEKNLYVRKAKHRI